MVNLKVGSKIIENIIARTWPWPKKEMTLYKLHLDHAHQCIIPAGVDSPRVRHGRVPKEPTQSKRPCAIELILIGCYVVSLTESPLTRSMKKILCNWAWRTNIPTWRPSYAYSRKIYRLAMSESECATEDTKDVCVEIQTAISSKKVATHRGRHHRWIINTFCRKLWLRSSRRFFFFHACHDLIAWVKWNLLSAPLSVEVLPVLIMAWMREKFEIISQ